MFHKPIQRAGGGRFLCRKASGGGAGRGGRERLAGIVFGDMADQPAQRAMVRAPWREIAEQMRIGTRAGRNAVLHTLFAAVMK
jgi:hypothetical protein